MSKDETIFEEWELKLLDDMVEYDKRENALNEGMEKGLKKGIEQGIEQGSKQEKIEIAKKMLEDEVPLETILKYTNLTKEEIEDLN